MTPLRPGLLCLALLAPSSAAAVTARFAYEQAYDNVNDGDWNRLANDEDTVLTNNQSQVMESQVAMFRATGDPVHLERLIWHADGALSQRDDVRHVIDYRGVEGACWQDRYYSGGHNYCWVLHSGTIIAPMVQAAWLIRERGLEDELAHDGLTFGEKADAYVRAAQETVAYHEEQWHPMGHYAFREDATFLGPEAGTANPLNCSNAMGRALLYLWLLTGDPAYGEKVTSLAHRLRDNMVRLEGGFQAWPYYAEDILGVGEDIGHASISVLFARELYDHGVVFDDRDMAAIAATLTRSVSVDDRTVLHNLAGGEVDAELNGRSTLFVWLPLAPWEPGIYPIVRNLAELETPPESVLGGIQLLAWAMLAEHEPRHCVPALAADAWPDPDPAADTDWREATTATPGMVVPGLALPCVTPLEVDAPAEVTLRQQRAEGAVTLARWQATEGPLTRWLAWTPADSALDLAPITLDHEPGTTPLRVREHPALAAPVVVTPTPTPASLGEPASLQLEGSGEAPLWWSLARFPTGARVDPATGLILWTPTAEGEQAFTLRLDTVNGSAEQDFVWCVGPACGQARPVLPGCDSVGHRAGGLLALLGLGALARRRRRLLPLALLLGGCHPEPPAPDSDPPDPRDSRVVDTQGGPDTPPADSEPPPDTGPVDADGDGWPAAEDCDDSDPARHPAARDLCDGVDDDCDGVVDDACALAVSGGLAHSCALMLDGSVRCWGSDSRGQSSAPEGRFTAVSAGSFHSCGVTEQGAVLCWGEDSSGQASPPEGAFGAVAAGYLGSAGVGTAGTLAHWGLRRNGLPNTPSGTDFVGVSCGEGHCCGLRADGAGACWGRDGYGLDEVDPDLRFLRLEAGYMHTCGLLDDGSILCWGWGEYGQTAAPAGDGFVDLSCGHKHCCASRADGSTTCWGEGDAGQTDPPAVPLVRLAAGAYHSCGLSAEGEVICWGNDAHGECGGAAGLGS